MASIKRFPKPGNLSDPQIGYIVSMLIEHENRVDTVIQEFTLAFPDKKISAEIVYAVQALYAKQINELQKEFEVNANKIPIAKRSWRLNALQKLAEWAAKPRLRYTMRTEIDHYEQFIGPDAAIVLKAVLAAEKIQMDAARLDMDRLRLLSSLSDPTLAGGASPGDDEEDDEEIKFG